MGFWDDLTGKSASRAANAAAADQYGKQTAAADEARGAGNTYLSGLLQQSDRYNPYIQSGNAALTRLMAGLGLGGDQQAFTQAYQSLPGYQSGLDTGAKAVTSRLNAGPGIQSGAAMKALQRYGSDYENQRSGDYLNRLASLGTQGLGATQSSVNTASQGYGGQLQGNLAGAQMMYGAAPTIGQGQIAGANAQAAGAQNLFNAGTNILGKIIGGGGFGGFGSSFGGGGTGGTTWADNSSPYFMQGGNSYPMFR